MRRFCHARRALAIHVLAGGSGARGSEARGAKLDSPRA